MKHAKFYWWPIITSITTSIIIYALIDYFKLCNTLTNVSVAVIFGVFLYYIVEFLPIIFFTGKVRKKDFNIEPLNNIKSTQNIWEEYKNSFFRDNKTELSADMFFNVSNICKSLRVNLRFVNSASGMLVGLGLLGTFLGLSYGVAGFKTDSADEIAGSITSLLSGMGTAFYTSLLGMAFSSIFIVLEKIYMNRLVQWLHTVCFHLDKKYLISRKDMFEELFVTYCTSKNEVGKTIYAGNILRDLYEESQKQAAALQSFSTDLALKLNEEFDKVMSHQLQEQIVPLISKLNETTLLLLDKFENLSSAIKNPASDMAEKVVEELKKVMAKMTDEFNTSLSGSATAQLNELANNLSKAGDALTSFPDQLKLMTSNLSGGFDKMEQMIDNLSNTTNETSNAAIRRMQEQMEISSVNMHNMIEEVKNGISHINADYITNTKKITDENINLSRSQIQTSQEMQQVLSLLNESIDNMSRMNDRVRGTMDIFTQAQMEVNKVTSTLTIIATSITTATNLLKDHQNNFVSIDKERAEKQKEILQKVSDSLGQAQQVATDYSQKFSVIEQGLASIFSQIKTGLDQYSNTVRDNTGAYLKLYTDSLSKATSSLSNAIESQSEIVEALNESLENIRS